MRIILFLILAAVCLPAWAQKGAAKSTNAAPTEISSDSAVFDNNTRRLIYTGHVLVVDPKVVLHCATLTVDLPPEGQSRPTNIVAETGVNIDYVDEKGTTNHLTANKAVYTYHVIGGVTNGTIVFTGTPGNPPKVQNPQFSVVSEPLVRDLVTDKYHFTNEIITINQSAMNGTNATQMNFFK
ncbi:MAG TPA: LptA/OstA family protein [Verrucomicrobiae bacterium]|nr:LptA/OstA family protein [Verrucomicrobiae bacterium]